MPVSPDGKTWRKVLSKNDVGETGGHQSGVYIPIKDYTFFEPIDTNSYTSERLIKIKDNKSNVLYWTLHWYSSKSELHLTRCNDFLVRHNIVSGDTLILKKIKNNFRVSYLKTSYDYDEEESIAIEASEIAAGRKNVGQGFIDSVEKRELIERVAMNEAIRYYKSKGYKVVDVHETNPYDLLCVKSSIAKYIEVKGTVSEGDKVYLTKNEVSHARDNYPQGELFILRSIQIEKIKDNWEVGGGEVLIIESWYPSDEDLIPLSYEYSIVGDK
jgi:hypothetical protein